MCDWSNQVWSVSYNDLHIGWPTASGVEVADVEITDGDGINPETATVTVDDQGQIHIASYESGDESGMAVTYGVIGPTP